MLLLMYKTTQDKMYLDIAQKVGTNLVESIQSKNCLAGMAHGYSGMGSGNGFIGKDIQEKEIIKKLCWSYVERKTSCLIVQMNNWLDIREGREHPRNTVAWCHGSAGILLARALIHKISGLTMDQLFKDIPIESGDRSNVPDRKKQIGVYVMDRPVC